MSREDSLPPMGGFVTGWVSAAARQLTKSSVVPGVSVRGRLFRKYVALFVAVVCIALLANGLFETWFSYQDHKVSIIRIQREQAEAAAAKIGQFVKEIEVADRVDHAIAVGGQYLAAAPGRCVRLLRQVPAITEFTQIDPSGVERLRVSRLATDVLESRLDLSKEPKFIEAVARKSYHGPVYFRHESEPYMTLALAGAIRAAGVSVAEVNLKFIWDLVSQIKVGEHGKAYVVDAQAASLLIPTSAWCCAISTCLASPKCEEARRPCIGNRTGARASGEGR